MRVVLVVGHFPEESQTFVVSHFLGLLSRGVDAHVICSRSNPQAWSQFPELMRHPGVQERIHVHAPRRQPLAAAGAGAHGLLWASRSPRPGARALAGARARPPGLMARNVLLAAAVARLRPDLVHFEFGVNAVRAVWLGDSLDVPTVVSLRGYDINYAGLDQAGYYDEVWARTDAVHVLSGDLWARALRRGCPPDMPRMRITPAVDTAWFAPAHDSRRGSGPLVILTVARLHWKKGYEHTLAAVASLRDAGVDVEYRIVGDGPYEDAVRACIHDFGLSDRVRLLGAQSREGVRRELQQADVLVHGAVSEGFCNAVLEAQACALPVVCTDADGLGENVTDGVSGIVVPRRDSAALAEAVGGLAADPDARRTMGEAGRLRASERFRLDRQPDQFLELYKLAYEARAERLSARSAQGSEARAG